MDLIRLRQILDAYGGRPEHWPDAERDAVVEYLSQTEDTKTLVAEQIALEALLDEMPAGEVSASLNEAVLSSAAEHLSSIANKQIEAATRPDAPLGWWSRFVQGSRGWLVDVDTMQWSGPTLAKSTPVLGSAAILGFLVAVYAPTGIDDGYMKTLEDEIFVAAFSVPDYGMDDFSLNGVGK